MCLFKDFSEPNLLQSVRAVDNCDKRTPLLAPYDAVTVVSNRHK
jgi:hypothetical protein